MVDQLMASCLSLVELQPSLDASAAVVEFLVAVNTRISIKSS